MATPNQDQPLSSPLVSAFNNIVNIKRSATQMQRTKSSYDDFIRFMNVEVKNLEAIKLPDEKEIKKVQTLNVTPTFGSAGSLLSSLISGALDLGGLVSNFFGGKRKNPSPKTKPIPKNKKLRIPGLRGLPLISAALAGLDFAQGLGEGESVGKAGAGALGSAAGAAGGAIAGTALAGAIGQALVPVPGLGFVLGAAVGSLGSFAGGWLADRAYESVTGEGKVKSKQDEKLAQAEAAQKAKAQVSSKLTLPEVLDKFDSVVDKFERFAYEGFANTLNAMAAATGQDQNLEWGAEYPDNQQGSGKEFGNGELESVMAEGGTKPSTVIKTSGFGPRWGRMHQGNDYAGPKVDHEPISVIQPGKVGHAGWLGSAGNAVVIDHPDGSTSKYFHLANNSIKVSKGQDIVPGQVIGTVGTTGRSTGVHLHFEIWKNGSPIDPSAEADNYFRFGGNVKVTPKATASAQPGSGAPTVVLAAGTNNFGDKDPAQAKAALQRSIKDLKSKGYNVVYIPPNSEGEFANISAALSETATASGATIERARYGTGGRQERAHFAAGEADRIRNKYKGATFMGDSNAAGLGGEKAGMRVTGESMQTIAGFTKNLKPVTTSSVQAKAAPQSTAQPVQRQVAAPEQLQQYPSYNTPQNTVTVVPIVAGGSGSGDSNQRPVVVSSGNGGQTTIIHASERRVLNSVYSTSLLTNLSGT